jgi:hypothetical protein
MTIHTPVAFIIFNRPDTTERVFQAIRQAQPKKLLVIADGPRADRPGEAEKCAAARAVIDQVDWDCEVLKNYSDINLGCGVRPATGISWVFEQVEEAIILEDDCLPSPSFFLFCQELLERYRYDERVMTIGGTNCIGEWKSNLHSYHFSCLSGIWGWATWRRAWKFYDYDMKLWNQSKETKFLSEYFPEKRHGLYWQDIFQKAYEDDKKTFWDYQWIFARWAQNGLGITPATNLISNIGFGPDATHTFSEPSLLSNLIFDDLNFPITHPSIMVRDSDLDNLIQEKFFVKSEHILFNRIARKVKNKFSSQQTQ